MRKELIVRKSIYSGKEHKLIERKFQLKNIFQGQIYQLWAQYLCMKEMGYDVKTIAFYEISTNKMVPIELPNKEQLDKFRIFLETYRYYDPTLPLKTNVNKCQHCVYCSICDKMEGENVFQ